MDDKIRALFQINELTRVSDQIIGLLRNAIGIKTRPVESKTGAPIGASKIGGWPDLPASTHWPEWREQPIPFLAQIRLSEIAHLDEANELPHSGMLYFFFDEEALEGPYPLINESWRVIYDVSNPLDLQHTPAASEIDRVYPECTLEFSSRLTLPPFESYYLQNLGLSYSAFERDAPPEQRKEADAYMDLEQQLDGSYDSTAPHHQLLGHPYQIQGDLLWECEQDTGQSNETTDWRLLFQIDTDDDANMMWGDTGILYFYISQQALAARDFSQVHLIMQCS
jgi:uncharacterized protein YwqG